MYDVIDPEDPEHRVPSRLALRGQRPGPADVAAAARCRLRHVEVGEGMKQGVRDVHPTTYLVLSDIYGRVAQTFAGEQRTPVRADDERLTGNGRFLTFDRGMSLDHCEQLRPPDEKWGPDGRTHVWKVGELGSIVSGPEGIGGGLSGASYSGRWTPGTLADAIACLAAAQDDQRCRFDRGASNA
jgi:hypothetical protein